MDIDDVAQMVATLGVVEASQLAISMIGLGEFIVIRPMGRSRDTVVKAIPERVWEMGFTFQPWSPLDRAEISIPSFKIWLDLVGVPIEAWRECEVIRAVSQFGTYLGSMQPKQPGNRCIWPVVVAMRDLQNVPKNVVFDIGGRQITARVRPRKWVHAQIYTRQDLPPYLPPYCRPSERSPTPPASPTTSDEMYSDLRWFQGEDVIHMRLSSLREIFRGVEPSALPPDLAACLAGNKQAITANNAAYHRWQQQRDQRSTGEAVLQPPQQQQNMQLEVMPHGGPQAGLQEIRVENQPDVQQPTTDTAVQGQRAVSSQTLPFAFRAGEGISAIQAGPIQRGGTARGRGRPRGRRGAKSYGPPRNSGRIASRLGLTITEDVAREDVISSGESQPDLDQPSAVMLHGPDTGNARQPGEGSSAAPTDEPMVDLTWDDEEDFQEEV